VAFSNLFANKTHLQYFIGMLGVLAIQGSVIEHVNALPTCGVEPVLVKSVEDLKGLTGLIIPGGESTTIGKLMKKYGLDSEIIRRGTQSKLCFWGTCAGAILIAKKIIDDDKVFGLKLMDIAVSRNSYGRQLDSFETDIEFDFGGNKTKAIPAIFIRAPRILEIGKNAKVLAKYKGEAVAVREKNYLATTFHPELTNDLSVHKYFVSMCELL
jgi:5'-phosphate synthase pdxT subunit